MTDVLSNELINITHEITDMTFENEFDSITDENYIDLLESIIDLIDQLDDKGEEKEKDKQSGEGEIYVDETIDGEEIYNLVCIQF